MVDVFISYSRDNRAVVRRLADAVKAEGYSVWWDDELPPHLSYGDVITEKIGEAKAAIVVWSEAAAKSEWVRAEADVARNQKKLIQTSIDGRMPPMPFNQIQFAGIGDWQGEADHPGWQKVKASLAALCGADAPERPLYPMPSSPPPGAAGAEPHRWHKLLIVVIALAFLFIAGAGLFALMRGAPEAPPAAPAEAAVNVVAAPEAGPNALAPAQAAERPVGTDSARAAEARAAPAESRVPAERPATPRPAGQRENLTPEQLRMRHFCMNEGHGTPQCRRFFQRMQALRKEGRL